jgi:hypothetical protein
MAIDHIKLKGKNKKGGMDTNVRKYIQQIKVFFFEITKGIILV